MEGAVLVAKTGIGALASVEAALDAALETGETAAFGAGEAAGVP